jgi:hypothetical protein
MIKKYTLVFTTVILIFSLLIGCSSEDELKLEVLEAISKQNEISSYHFNGSANLHLDWASLTQSRQDPLTASLTGLLTNSNIQWEGAAQKESAQLEMDLTIQPHQSDSTFSIPIIIKDNKLYFNIPLLTVSDEEYLYLDLEGDLTSLPFTSILTHIAEAMDEKMFEEINKDDDETTKTIAIHITQENIQEIIESLQTKLPLIITELENSNLINTEKATQWREYSASELADKIMITDMDEAGLISFTINQQGFITEQALKLYFANQSLEINNRLDNINQDFQFEKEIPEQIRLFQ